jgi:hypothetical protein
MALYDPFMTPDGNAPMINLGDSSTNSLASTSLGSTDWMSGFGMGLGGFGMGLSMMSAYNRGRAQQNALGYEAAVAGNNAAIAGYQANVAQQVGAQQVQNIQLRTGNLFGAQRAAMAANGVDLGQGSAANVLASTEYMGQRDEATTQTNTQNEIWALNNQRNSYLAEQQADLSARNSINPTMSAAGTLIGGAGMFANSWYRS